MDASGSMDATEDVSLESGHAEPKAQQLVDDVLVYATAVVDGTAQKNRDSSRKPLCSTFTNA